jgi:acyl-CoA thioester hydrolase
MANCASQSQAQTHASCRGHVLVVRADRQNERSLAQGSGIVSQARNGAGLAGGIDVEDGQRVHRLAIRVYYEDTDFSGVAYHASYVRWCERGRSDFLRLLGVNHRDLLAGDAGHVPAALMVKRLVLDYRRPARVDDVVVVETRLAAIGAATLELRQAVVQGEGAAAILLTADVTIVLVALDGRVLRLGKRLGPIFAEPRAQASDTNR